MSTTIKHHPDDATLMSYAAGALEEPLAAVVAAHVAMCPHCRAEVADLERVGAALMLSAPVKDGSRLARPKRRKAEISEQTPAVPLAGGDGRLPAPLASVYDLTMDSIPWRRLGPGVWHHRLPLRAKDGGDLRLLLIGAGRKMPEHGHGGMELTLVLDGAYSDVTGEYRRGDVQDVDEDIEHRPIVGRDECTCLIATVHPARFKSLIGKIMQPWTGL